jgi:MFS family permease
MGSLPRSIHILFIANGISGFAQGISMLAIPWYFATQQASSYFNTAYAFITLIVLFFGLYAGVLVDKYSRKSNFLFTNFICALLLLGIAAIGYAMQALPNIFAIAVFGITMLNYNIHYPTLYALGQELSPPQFYHKLNANIELVSQSTSILSGAAAAMLLDGVSAGNSRIFGIDVYMPFAIPKWDIWEIFLLNGITYLLAGILIYFIKYTPNLTVGKAEGNIIKRLKTGFSFLKLNPTILIFGMFSFAVFAMLLVEIHAVLPAYVERHLKEDGSVFALADGIYAVGALMASLYVAKVFSGNHAARAVIVLTLTTVVIFVVAALTRSVLIIYTVSLILGFTNAGIRVLRMTYLFQHVPNEIIGRVGSIFNMANVLVRSLFIFFFATYLFDDGAIRMAYIVMAIFLVISAGVLIYFYRKIVK